MSRLESLAGESKATLRVANDADADRRTVPLRAHDDAFHRTFFSRSDQPAQCWCCLSLRMKRTRRGLNDDSNQKTNQVNQESLACHEHLLAMDSFLGELSP